MAPIEGAVFESQRERAKQQRRDRIVEAASALARQRDISEISVVMIAEQAQVDPATVYNLFGTKNAVITKVYEAEMDAFETRVAAKRASNALDRIFKAVVIAADLLREDPMLYRSTMSVSVTRADRKMATDVQSPRTAFWQRCVEALIDEGLVRPDTDAELTGLVMIQISAGALGHWVLDIISTDRMELETQYGFANVLLPVATPETEAWLKKKLASIRRALAARRDERRY